MHNWLIPLVLAAHPTTLDRLRHIPTETWTNLAIFAIGAFVLFRLWKTLRHINDYAPYLASAVVACSVFFYWVYSRTEPAFLTPVVERITPFFPTKNGQQENIEKVRHSRES